MAASQHAWVLGVPHDIIAYADKFGLTNPSATCQAAQAAALLEIGPACAGPSDPVRQQGFIDTLRNLLDHADRAKLTPTRDEDDRDPFALHRTLPPKARTKSLRSG